MKHLFNFFITCLLFLNTVVAMTWSTVENISNPADQVIRPQVAVNLQGHAIAVWQYDHGNVHGIQFAYLPFGGNWTSPQTLTIEGTTAGFPWVAINDQNEAIIVWQAISVPPSLKSDSTRVNITPPSYIAIVRIKGGLQLSSPSIISDPTATAFPPKVALNNLGQVVVVWGSLASAPSAYSSVYACSFLWGEQPSAPIQISIPDQDGLNPYVALNDQGNCVAVWEKFTGSNLYIQGTTCSFNQAWTPPKNISPPSYPALLPSVVIDHDGQATAVWQGSNGNNFVPQISILNSGASQWSTPDSLSNSTENGVEPQISLTKQGQKIVVWEQAVLGISKVAFSIYDGNTWSQVAYVPSGTGDSSAPMLASSDLNHAIAIWQQDTGATYQTIESAYLLEDSWMSLPVLSTSGLSTRIGIAMNKNGYAVAVWVVTDGLTETVQAATSISGINALVGKQITNRSALQTNFINCLEWSASPSPISSYKIYRNGSLLKEVSGFDRHYNDISARRNESYVYSIVGITLDQSETESVSITLP